MKILLACSAGMSTSMLENSIKKYMNENKIKGEVIAKPVALACQEIEKWDVILLGPQVKFMIGKFDNKIGVPVAVIPPQDYALAKGDKVYKLAEEVLKNKK